MINIKNGAQAERVIMEALFGERGGKVSELTDKCEELFANTVLAGIDKSSCPPAHPEAVDADQYYDAVIFRVSTDLKFGNINISVSDAAMCSIDFGSHGYKPDGAEIATVCNHLTARGFEVLKEGSSLNFSLSDPEQISALRTFEAAQKERNDFIHRKSGSL